jgi:hypothetical protein
MEDKMTEIEMLRIENDDFRKALQSIACLWPEQPNCADVLSVNGINDGKQRAILLDAALKISRAVLD